MRAIPRARVNLHSSLMALRSIGWCLVRFRCGRAMRARPVVLTTVIRGDADQGSRKQFPFPFGTNSMFDHF